jgi:hypothetical protein
MKGLTTYWLLSSCSTCAVKFNFGVVMIVWESLWTRGFGFGDQFSEIELPFDESNEAKGPVARFISSDCSALKWFRMHRTEFHPISGVCGAPQVHLWVVLIGKGGTWYMAFGGGEGTRLMRLTRWMIFNVLSLKREHWKMRARRLITASIAYR